MKIKTIFIDVGGVLVRTESTKSRRIWEQKLHIQPLQLTKEIYKIEPAASATIGLISAEKIWQNVGEKFSLESQELRKLREDFFEGDKLNINLYNFIKILHKKHKIALFTNAWDDARKTNIHRFHLDKICDKMIISAEVGMRKPHKDFFNYALTLMNVTSSESIYIDDRLENIKVGREMRFHSILFKNTDKTIDKINALL